MRRGLLSRRFDSLSRNGIFGGVFSGPTEARHSACSLCHSGQVMGLSQESRSDVVHQVQRQTGDLRGAALPLPSCVRWCPREQAVNATTSLTGTKSKNLAEVRHLHFPCYCSVLNAVGGARSLSRERQGLVLVRSPFRSTKKRGNARDDAGVAGGQYWSEPSSRAWHRESEFGLGQVSLSKTSAPSAGDPPPELGMLSAWPR